jgi:glycosyltransferase involved in cell wall biosynthesis
MSPPFDAEHYPGRPRILFIGAADSTHTHSWIDLLDGEPFNVRLFATSNGLPPNDWKVRTYVTAYSRPRLDPAWRLRLFDSLTQNRFVNRSAACLGWRSRKVRGLAAEWLAGIVKAWHPHIVHTLGLEAAGEFYFDVAKHNGLSDIGKWVLQLRGGSDLQLTHLDPVRSKEIAPVLRGCDQLLSDNRQNFRIAREMGVREEQLSRIGTVPGTGGIDVDSQARKSKVQPSERRVILWAKVYQGPWQKAIPVYEALKQCWERIQPCELHLLAMSRKAQAYYWTLPKRLRAGCVLNGRIPRTEVLEAMTRARVMLAPSLVDGTPNSMFEAMASGALPIVSPLETIRSVVDEQNVLFARNLYPDEIASALVRAMSDDALVDTAAKLNLELVRRVANRTEIRRRVVAFYNELAY